MAEKFLRGSPNNGSRGRETLRDPVITQDGELCVSMAQMTFLGLTPSGAGQVVTAYSRVVAG